MQESVRPNLWRRIAQLQLIALCVTGTAALILNVVMVATDMILRSLLYGGVGWPKTDLFLWPILFAASPLVILHATQQCFRFKRAAAFVACGTIIAGLLGLLCGLLESVISTSPLSAPLIGAGMSAAGYLLIGVLGILFTAWIVEDESTPARPYRRRRGTNSPA